MGESPAGSSPCELGVQMPRTCQADRKGAGRTTGETRRVTRDTAPPHPRNCVTPASRRIRAVVFRVTQTAASPGFARVRITYALIYLLLLFHAVLSERFSLALPSPSYLQIPRAHELVTVPLMDAPRFHDHSNPVVPTCLASASSPFPTLAAILRALGLGAAATAVGAPGAQPASSTSGRDCQEPSRHGAGLGEGA